MNKTDMADCCILDILPYKPCFFDIAIITKTGNLKGVCSKTLICPSEHAFEIVKLGRFNQIVTYGTASRDTVTMSAVSSTNVTVCFQREILPLLGFSPSLGEIRTPLFENIDTSLIVSAVFRSLGIV